MTETVVVGTPIESVTLVCDPIRILRFGASTHNSHRIHYDASYAQTEGLSAPVVMAQLQGTLFFVPRHTLPVDTKELCPSPGRIVRPRPSEPHSRCRVKCPKSTVTN